MTRKFSIRPTLTMRGRTFKGVRGWSGKPTHPPLTDLPIAAYLFGAALDVIAALGRHQPWAQDYFRAGTFLFIGGGAVSVLTILTGFWDWLRSSEQGTQARRTANVHALAMLGVTGLVAVDITLRTSSYDTRTHPSVAILAISLVLAGLAAVGATFGGTLVFEYGFNVETATDSAVWQRSEVDVMPGDHEPEANDDEPEQFVMSPATQLAEVEEAVTDRTPDPLVTG